MTNSSPRAALGRPEGSSGKLLTGLSQITKPQVSFVRARQAKEFRLWRHRPSLRAVSGAQRGERARISARKIGIMSQKMKTFANLSVTLTLCLLLSFVELARPARRRAPPSQVANVGRGWRLDVARKELLLARSCEPTRSAPAVGAAVGRSEGAAARVHQSRSLETISARRGLLAARAAGQLGQLGSGQR